MGSPAFAERLEAPVTVRRAEFHGEDLAQFAVEVGRFGLRQLPEATEHRQQAALQILALLASAFVLAAANWGLLCAHAAAVSSGGPTIAPSVLLLPCRNRKNGHSPCFPAA